MEGVDGEGEAEPEPEDHSETIERVLGHRRGKKGGKVMLFFFVYFHIIKVSSYINSCDNLHFGASIMLNFS